MRGAEESLLDHVAHHRHPGHTTDEQYLIDLTPCHSRLLHHDFADGLALLEQVACSLFEIFARQIELHALAVVAVDDRRARAARELDLGGERAVLQVLVALQVEQRIFAVRSSNSSATQLTITSSQSLPPSR